MEPHIRDWVTKTAQVPREFKLPTYQFECYVLAYWAICNTFYYMWQSERGLARGFSRTYKMGWVILILLRPLNVVFKASELEPVSVSSSTFLFWFRTLFIIHYLFVIYLYQYLQNCKSFRNSKIVNYSH